MRFEEIEEAVRGCVDERWTMYSNDSGFHLYPEGQEETRDPFYVEVVVGHAQGLATITGRRAIQGRGPDATIGWPESGIYVSKSEVENNVREKMNEVLKEMGDAVDVGF